MNLAQSIPETERSLGHYADWREQIINQFEGMASDLVGPGYGEKIFVRIFDSLNPGKTGNEGVVISPFSVQVMRDGKLHLQAKVETGKNHLTNKPIVEWKNWSFTMEQLQAL